MLTINGISIENDLIRLDERWIVPEKYRYIPSGYWDGNGTLYGAGYNSQGQLGDNTTTLKSTPIQIGPANRWVGSKTVVSPYANHMLTVGTDGVMYGFGANTNYALANITTTNKLSPIQVTNATNWATAYVGVGFTHAIKEDGTLWAWGANNVGQLGVGHTTALVSPAQVGTLTWKTLSGNQGWVNAIRSDGTLWSWGNNNTGQLGVNGSALLQVSSPIQVGTLTDWKSVTGTATGAVMAIKNDNSLWSWGANSWGELGQGDTTRRSSPVQVGTLTNWKSISAGAHVLAIKQDGTLWAWGANTYGQLGDSTTTNKSSPIQIGTGTDWKMVSASYLSSWAIKQDGTLWAWGHNGYGQLGIGAGLASNRSSPVQVGSSNLWSYITASMFTHYGTMKG